MVENRHSTVVCVLGMHRSGTSAVANALRVSGVDFGPHESMIAPANDNPEGFWENSDIVNFHDMLLKELGRSWSDARPFNLNVFNTVRSGELVQTLWGILQQDFSSTILWGWKDPRGTLFVPLWDYMGHVCGVELKYLVVVRNPIDVAKSLVKRNGMTFEHAISLWYWYNLNAVLNTINKSSAIILYEDFMNGAADVIEEAYSRLGLTMYDQSLRDDVNEVVKVNLRHGNTGSVDGTDIPSYARELYRLCVTLARDKNSGTTPEIQSDLERLMAEYHRYGHLQTTETNDVARMQLFHANDSHWNEIDSVTIPVNASGDIQDFEVDVPSGTDIKLRLDPADGSAAIVLHELSVWDKSTDSSEAVWSMRNDLESLHLNDELIFLTKNEPTMLLSMGLDPQITIPTVHGFLSEGLRVRIGVSLQKFSLDELPLVVKSLVSQRDSLLDENQHLLHRMDKLQKGLTQVLTSRRLSREKVRELNEYATKLANRIKDLESQNAILLSTEEEFNRNFLTSNRQLELILESDGYKLLLNLYQIRDTLLPRDSFLFQLFRSMRNCVRNRESVTHLFTKRNIMRFIDLARHGGLGTAVERVNSKMDRALKHISGTSLESRNIILDGLIPDSGHTTVLPNSYVVDIIVPIYGAYEYLIVCLNSLVMNTDVKFNLYLIDDCSPDPRVREFLKVFREGAKSDFLEHVEVIYNHSNCGFVQTVNTGLDIAKNDVVIVNTDTELPPEWLSRIIRPLLTDSTVASVTPFSNAGSICSFPEMCEDNSMPYNMEFYDIDGVFKKYAPTGVVDIPTGVGFCMAMSRRAINVVGKFDAETYGAGYGEENDWCMRAAQAGFRHVLVTNLFVYHKHGVSFGQKVDIKRNVRMQNNLRKLLDRFPDYQYIVDGFIARDPVKPYRDLVLTAIVAQQTSSGTLFVSHGLGGGTDVYQEDYIQSRPNEERIYLFEIEGSLMRFIDRKEQRIFEFSAVNFTKEMFIELLIMANISLIYINNLISFPMWDLMGAIQSSGIDYVYFVHDYLSACPSFNLINNKGNFCGAETRVEKCQSCLRAGLTTENILGVKGSEIDISEWRKGFEVFLKYAREVFVPSTSTQDILKKYYPDLSTTVAEHGISPALKYTYDMHFANKDVLTIGFLGAIDRIKGSGILSELIKSVQSGLLEAKIRVIGYTDTIHSTFTDQSKMVHITGRYNKLDVSELLARHEVSLVVIPSICPETYSYTTTEALVSGFPVATFNIGAPAERVKRYHGGWVINEVSFQGLFTLLKQLDEDRNLIIEKARNLGL